MMKWPRKTSSAITNAGKVEGSVVGYLDSFIDGRFQGWVLDTRDLNSPLAVRLTIKGEEVHRAIADQPRQDLLNAGYASAFHGFDFFSSLTGLETLDDLELLASGPNGEYFTRVNLTPASREQLSQIITGATPESKRLLAIENVILIDIQDILEFLKDHNTVTGIQRVVGGMIQAIFAMEAAGRQSIVFCAISTFHGSVRIFDNKSALNLVDAAMAGDTNQVTLAEMVSDLRRNAISYFPKDRDVYFIAGAYWVVPDFSPRLNALKARGVIVGAYIYDLIPITAPEWVTDETRNAVTDRAIDIMFLSDFFLTISEFVATEVRQLLAMEVGEAKPVAAVTLPHQLPPRKIEDLTVRRSMRELPPFVLAVGTLEGRKNHILLFRIWAALLRKFGPDNVPVLVLVGRWGWNIERFKSLYESSNGLGGHIRIFNNVGDHELSSLYQRCMFTTFASFVEGWGLPVGESLSLGKTCLCSNTTSIPEVGREFCTYFNPHDFLSAYTVFETAINDRAAMEAKNARVVADFRPKTWDVFAEMLIARIRDTGRGSKPLTPHLEPMSLVKFTWNALVVDQSLPWIRKTLKFARTEGWWEIEDWGVWANKPEAVIEFQTGLVDTIVLVLLELQLPNERSRRSISSESFEMPPVEIKLTGVPTWKPMTVKTDHEGILRILFKAKSPVTQEGHRNIFFGLSKLVYFANRDGSVLDFLNALKLVDDNVAFCADNVDTKNDF